jgi:hypothetical protein
MYCIDAIRRIVTKSLYRTALPFSILSDISQISFEVLNIIPPLSCRLVSEVFGILGFPLSLNMYNSSFLQAGERGVRDPGVPPLSKYV